MRNQVKLNRELIRVIRNMTGLSQAEFGEKIGYSGIYVTYIEIGERQLSKKFESKIISVFNLTDEDIERINKMIEKFKVEVA